MPHRSRFILAFVVITALCWIDYQYYSEGGAVRAIDDTRRQMAHLIILILLVPIGWFGWSAHGVKWIRKFWLLTYLTAICFLITFGLIQSFFHPFGTTTKDIVSSIRLFFTSPMPFLLLQLIRMLLKRGYLHQ